jgi:hypothetical protein
MRLRLRFATPISSLSPPVERYMRFRWPHLFPSAPQSHFFSQYKVENVFFCTRGGQCGPGWSQTYMAMGNCVVEMACFLGKIDLWFCRVLSRLGSVLFMQVLHCSTPLYGTPHCTARHCTTLPALRYTVLYCIVL